MIAYGLGVLLARSVPDMDFANVQLTSRGYEVQVHVIILYSKHIFCIIGFLMCRRYFILVMITMISTPLYTEVTSCQTHRKIIMPKTKTSDINAIKPNTTTAITMRL